MPHPLSSPRWGYGRDKDALQSKREELVQSSEAVDENNLFFNIVGGK